MKMGAAWALKRVALAAVLALFALGAQPESTAAQSPIGFGILPPAGAAGDPEGGGYFTYILNAGDTVEDEVLVLNEADQPLTLKLYAADGVTAINGSTSFMGADEDRSGVRTWLSTDVSELDMAPGGSIRVPFSVRVPPGTPAGDHVAGWILEAPPRGGGAGGVGVTVLERAGVAVVVRVPGAATEDLVLGSVCLNQETGSNYFEISVQNDGNVMTKGSGALTVSREGDGEQVFSVPVELGTILPHDSTFLRVDAPGDPGPGSYVASLSLQQSDGRQIQTASPIEIGEEKVNGCASVAGVERQPFDPFIAPSVGEDGGGPPWLIIILVALVVLLSVVLVARELRDRRRRLRGAAPL